MNHGIKGAPRTPSQPKRFKYLRRLAVALALRAPLRSKLLNDEVLKRNRAEINYVLNRSATKTCMARSDCKKAIAAHSISEKRVLRRIAENGNVVAPSAGIHGGAEFTPQGISKISTFSGFCSKHDTTLFRPLDTHDYKPGDREQEYLFAYRTLSQYLWFSRMDERASEVHRKWFDLVANGEIETTYISTAVAAEHSVFHEQRRQEIAVFADMLRDLKDGMHPGLSTKSYTGVKTITIELPDEYPIAYSGAFLLQAGRSEEESQLDPYVATLNLFPQSGSTYGVLSCIKEEHFSYLENMFYAYEAVGVRDNREILTNLLGGTSDALAIRPSYWAALPEDTRRGFVGRWSRDIVLKERFTPGLNIFQDELLI